MEYFSFINLFLLFLFIIISLFFVIMCSTLLYYSTIHFNHHVAEFIITLFSLLFLIIIISPALVILIDYDSLIIPSLIVYSLGLQWGWQFNIIFLDNDGGTSKTLCDNYTISSKNRIELTPKIPSYPWLIGPLNLGWYGILSSIMNGCNLITEYTATNIILCSMCDSGVSFYINYPLIRTKIYNIINYFYWYPNPPIPNPPVNPPKASKYLVEISQYILLPLYSFIRLYVYSVDVIHTLGIYSWGIKIDVIPGRINSAITIRLLNKGEFKGKCFELCGQGHLSMYIAGIVM